MALVRETLIFLVLFCILIGCTDAFQRWYVTDLRANSLDCSKTSAPEYGYTIQFSRTSARNFRRGRTTFEPENVFDCFYTFQAETDLDGMPTTQSVSIREEFIVGEVGLVGTGSTPAECGKAYIQLLEGTAKTLLWTHCGTTLPVPVVYETVNQQLHLRVYVDFSFTQTTMNPNETTTISRDRDDYARVHFAVDFTSFVPNATCNFDEDKYLRCNDSLRCLHKTTRCDIAFARNCRDLNFLADNSDSVSGYPSYCGRQSLPEIEIDLLPLWILLGLLGASLVLYWCCWKPGYVPWRCGRLRNMRGGCCGSSSGRGCCAAGGICGAGGLCGPATPEGKAGACSMCSKCFRCCQGGGGGGGGGYGGGGYKPMGAAAFAGGKGGKGGKGDAGKQGGGAGDWRDFCAGDGFHLTECR